jgi:hypothetical protein
MENLIEFTETVVDGAGESCTPCLIEHLGGQANALPAAIARLKVAYEWLSDSSASKQEFAEAFAGFLTSAVKMAVITGELMHRPGVRWIDETTEIALPVITIPN